MSEIRFERRDLMLIAKGDEVIVQRALVEAEPLDLAEFRWLILSAGPALLCELRCAEEDAGTGGGPAPATPDATEPADEPEALSLDV